jgi:acyl-CoA reductase-like NAD-dependent aldehyde dehydrogenase
LTRAAQSPIKTREINAAAFTGSAEVGRRVAACGELMKPCVIEGAATIR